ncbi:MAG: methyl-accepting chemotaxis protein [Idiomarina sp.]|nr:methyl-accepting chemotaxis protein [Idiomarina sp.]
MSEPTSLAFRRSAFRIAAIVNLFLFVVALALAPWYGTWWPALLVGLPALIVPWWFYQTVGDHPLARISYGVSFMLFAALHIHQSMGFTEIHFGIFVLLAILIAFRDAWVIVVAAATIAVHHLLFMYLQASGAGVYLVPEADARLGIIWIHALYVVIEAIVLVIICRASLKEAYETQSFFDVTEKLVDSSGSIDLTQRATEHGSVPLARFNSVLATLENSVDVIRGSSQQTQGAASELVNEGQALSLGMKEQQKEVSRIAAASEEMTQNVMHTGEQSQQVVQAVQEAGASAREGQEVVSKTRNAVSDLAALLSSSEDKVSSMATSAEEIRSVLVVIDSIAEQTNLLALNAAIEAARAGEAGRGFAVVADEVRNLASKTRGSTEQVQRTIERLTKTTHEAVDAVEQCRNKVEETKAFAEISDDVLERIAVQSTHVTAEIQTIADALMQQNSASQEVTKSTQYLSQLSDERDQQADAVLDIARELSQVADELSKETGRFAG